LTETAAGQFGGRSSKLIAKDMGIKSSIANDLIEQTFGQITDKSVGAVYPAMPEQHEYNISDEYRQKLIDEYNLSIKELNDRN